MKMPLIIDTDVALGVHHGGRPRDIDDGFAIAEALNSDDLDLRLISCVYGNGPLDAVYRVAQEIAQKKASDVPVLPGAAVPLIEDSSTNAAVEGMARALLDQPAAVAAIGPLTNMALLAEHHPAAFANIETLLIVAGRTPGNNFYIGDIGPVNDFNFENDPQSTAIMLEAASGNMEIIVAGFELTSQVCVTADDLTAIQARGTPTAEYFYKNSLAWLQHWTDTFPADEGFHPWDSATISYLKHPHYFTTEKRSWSIVPKEDQPHLECSPDENGDLTYCTGFADGGAADFVADVVQSVY